MDPVDRIIVANSPATASHLLIIDAPALVAPALERVERISVWCDDIRDARQIPPELLVDRLEPHTLAGVDVVWLRLPQALGALDEYAGLIARHASADVQLVAAAREKHLNRSMNTTLARYFDDVAASLGQQKSRALLARQPVRPPAMEDDWPRHKSVTVGGHEIKMHWHGATFAAGRIDAGTQLLIDHLDRVADADHYLDFGSGSGLLATLLALAHPDASVDAVDTSRAAASATSHTATGTQVRAHWAADLADWPAGSLDVIVCNPPFHRGTAKDSGPAFTIFREASVALAEGGEFWCVYNSHLPWRAHLARVIGPTTLVAQNRHYTLTRSVKDNVSKR
ncbi:MAG: class I SAM-dependent methyltransferase [Brooklawnia sp.]|jgi:16S rRNA (guanine1207-N2)-methyltransferase